MGRHSIPDPEDSADQPQDFGADEPGISGPGQEPDYRDDGYWQSQRDASYDDDFAYLGHGSDGPDEDAFDANAFDDGAFDEDGLENSESPTRAFAANPSGGAQHDGGDWDGEWTGTHRAITTKRRGVSVSVIVALVTVVVVVGAIILWRFFGDALSNRSEVSAARCVEGEVAVAVVADPSIAEQVGALAEQYNQSADPVGDKCVKVGVRSADSDDVISGFADTWPAELGERPALWIPGSSVSEARLEAVAGGAITSDSRSLVTSPVLLAVRPQLKTALAQRSWSDLPPLQTSRTAFDALNLPGWGTLRLALPLSGDADATYVAAEAVAASSAPDGAPATAGVSAINTLVAGQPKLADTSASTAMEALLAGSDPAASSVHAVVSTEQQLFQRAASLPDAKSTLAGWLPSGPAAVADYPTVLLAGDWLAQEQVSAASEFARFLRKPDALAEFGKAGFRTDGGELPDSEVTDFGPLSEPVSVGDNALRATLAEAVSAPAQNPAVTIMLEQSMNTDEGGRSRLANVTATLEERLGTLAPTADVGLWTFDGVAGRSEVPFGPLGEQVGGQPRSEVLAENLSSQVASSGGSVSFTTLRLIYNEAMANYREGRANSVLVITTGPHTDRSLDGAGLQDFIRQAFQPGKPVAVNVIDFGADSDRATWEAVSQISGGTYQNLNSAAAPELSAALSTMLP